jgi:hypothetical protein
MSGANPFKFVLLPPQSDTTRDWAKRLAEIVPEARVILTEDADTAAGEIVDAEVAFGWVSSDLLLKARKLRWLQAPQAAPPAGYYYPELIAHSVKILQLPLKAVLVGRVPASCLVSGGTWSFDTDCAVKEAPLGSPITERLPISPLRKCHTAFWATCRCFAW